VVVADSAETSWVMADAVTSRVPTLCVSPDSPCISCSTWMVTASAVCLIKEDDHIEQGDHPEGLFPFSSFGLIILFI
jgi:hypothetical protein